MSRRENKCVRCAGWEGYRKGIFRVVKMALRKISSCTCFVTKKEFEPEGFRTRNLTISRQVLCHLHQPRTPIDGRLQEWYIFEVAGLKLDRGSYLDLYDSGIRVCPQVYYVRTLERTRQALCDGSDCANAFEISILALPCTHTTPLVIRDCCPPLLPPHIHTHTLPLFLSPSRSS